MCDSGRLNYPWVNAPNRLKTPVRRVRIQGSLTEGEVDWTTSLQLVRETLSLARGQLAILASGRCSTEEFFLLKRIAQVYGARTSDIVPRKGESDDILLDADKNPNAQGARLLGITPSVPGGNLASIGHGIESGEIKALLVVHECAIKAGIPASTLEKLQGLIMVDIHPNKTSQLAHFVLPGAAHLEKRGTFINGRKRMQRFLQAFPPPDQAREDWSILRSLLPKNTTDLATSFDGIFKEMCHETPVLQTITWNGLGHEGHDLSSLF
jgi:NADH-quinone oxidoreductase subunit G